MDDNLLLTADLHLTDNARDEYRWEIFPFILRQIELRGITRLEILGDLTDAKDNHSSNLVSRLVYWLRVISKKVEIDLIMGNHDYVDARYPFFQFLDSFPNINYFHEAETIQLSNVKLLFLPHTADVSYYFRTRQSPLWREPNLLVFFHQCLHGVKGANGQAITSAHSPTVFSDLHSTSYAIGGDIHDPQPIGRAEYVGAPYPIDFGDFEFHEPRLLQWHDGKFTSVHHACPGKKILAISALDELTEQRIKELDQVKIRYKLPRRDYDQWNNIHPEIKSRVNQLRGILCGLEVIPLIPRARLDAVGSNGHSTSEIAKGRSASEILANYASRAQLSAPEVEIGNRVLESVVSKM